MPRLSLYRYPLDILLMPFTGFILEASIWRLLQLAFLMLPLAIYWPAWTQAGEMPNSQSTAKDRFEKPLYQLQCEKRTLPNSQPRVAFLSSAKAS